MNIVALNLPIQNEPIDRSTPCEPYMVNSAFMDDNTPALYSHQPGGPYGPHPGDPSAWKCKDTEAINCHAPAWLSLSGMF